MRVLFLTHRLPYTANRGDRVRALHTLKLLASRAEVDLVSLVHSADEESHAPNLRGLASSVTVVRVNRVRGWARAALALPARGTLTHAILDAPPLKPAITHLVDEHKPDVVLAYCSGMARLALEPPLAHLPLVLDMVDVDSEKWRTLSATTKSPWRWVYATEARRLAAFETRAAHHARASLVVNRRERDALLRLAPSATVHVVPNGVDVDDLRPMTAPSDEPRVCFCGVMNYPPNEQAVLWFAREVWPTVRHGCPGARFSIVGSEPTRAVCALAVSDSSINVTGSVADVRPSLWQSALSVAPLFIARGVQNKVLEAVAAGLPCVVTPAVREGMPPEVLPGCIEASDASTFAAAVLDLLGRSPAERRAMAERADLAALGWEQRLQPILGILRSAASATDPASR